MASDGIHTVFSSEDSTYQWWQGELLAWTHAKVKQEGSLTKLLSHEGEPRDTIVPNIFQVYPTSGKFKKTNLRPHDDYTPYNKPNALQQWLRKSPPEEDTILLIDPDCIFVSPVRMLAAPGRPVSQKVSYMSPIAERARKIVKRHCKRNASQIDAVGIPTLIHKEDLGRLVGRWVNLVAEIRDSPLSKELAGWVAEMWAYTIAAAEYGFRHIVQDLARVPLEEAADKPLIHYCYASTTTLRGKQQFKWDKREYRPWRPPKMPPKEAKQTTKVLLETLQQYAEMQENKLIRWED